MTNWIRMIGDPCFMPISDLDSINYDPARDVWRIAFGNTELELTPDQALRLRRACEGIKALDGPT